ncbi:MAG: diguanylate cyclase, partial [Nitrospirota bacterium]|nr:diguanylate cyclase [Nitrospirota bacterium]
MVRKEEELDQFKKMLRTVAEKKVDHLAMNDTIITSQKALIHELRVHQIELEMQNEELRQAHVALEETRDRYFDLYEFAPVGYLTLSSEAIIKEVNLTGAALLGDRARLLNHRFSSRVILEDRDRWYRHFLYTLRHGGKQNCELTLVRGDKTTFNAFLNSVHIPDGQFPAVRVALTDISERKRMDEELRIAGIAFDSQEAMLVTDKEGVILRANSALTQMTGYSGNELVGRTTALFRSDHHGPSFYSKIMETLKEKKRWKGEMWNRRKNGKIYAEWVNISAVTDTNGCPTHYVYIFSDITRNPESAAEIHRLAYYDALTQLPNRRLLLDRIVQAMAASTRTGNYGAILFLDLDHFKTINDARGHELGDQLLVEVANRLQGILREMDTISRAGSTISRLGGDEFVILLENLSNNAPDSAIHATQVAEKVHECLARHFELPSGKISCTTSLGMTLLYKREQKVTVLLKQADLA